MISTVPNHVLIIYYNLIFVNYFFLFNNIFYCIKNITEMKPVSKY